MITLFLAAVLDSQVVLQKYLHALEAVRIPKTVIFSYGISQAGPSNIEQKHVMYRSGNSVRDELVGASGPKSQKTTITSRIDRYAISQVAPRASVYGFVFSRRIVSNGEILYLYTTAPLATAALAGFAVTSVAIDGTHFLPRSVAFRATNGVVGGNGILEYAPVGGYWVPMSARVVVRINGKSAQERITWSGYRFPASLPALTFTK